MENKANIFGVARGLCNLLYLLSKIWERILGVSEDFFVGFYILRCVEFF